MAFMHTRYPYSLNDHDYGEFTDELEQFLSDDRSEPNRPDQWVADQQAKGSTYRTKLDEMNLALAEQKTITDAVKVIVKRMDEKLRWMRNILPTLSDESILLPFGMDKEIPRGYAEVKDYADTANSHWQTVKGENLFAPVKALCDELDGIITDFETNRAAQEAAAGEYEQRNNEKDNAREAHHIIERKIFDWYASFYPNGQDDYWTMTPWGKAPEKEDDKFLPPAFLAYEQYKNEYTWQSVAGATGYELEISKDSQTWQQVYKGAENHKVVAMAQGDWEARVRAVKVSSPEQFSDWKTVPVKIVFKAPGNLHYDAPAKKIKWDNIAGAAQYQLVDGSAMPTPYIGGDHHYDIELTGQNNFRVRAGDNTMEVWGEWTDWITLG